MGFVNQSSLEFNDHNNNMNRLEVNEFVHQANGPTTMDSDKGIYLNTQMTANGFEFGNQATGQPGKLGRNVRFNFRKSPTTHMKKVYETNPALIWSLYSDLDTILFRR